MERERKDYLAFLLRLWRVNDAPAAGQATSWRASLESPHTGERIGFGSLAELYTFLTQEVMRCEAGDAPPADHSQTDR